MTWFSRLLAVAVLGVVALLVAAIVLPSPRPTPPAGYSHSQLEADRMMTQYMSFDTGSGMQAVMEQNSMLQRSEDPAYLRALEWHAYEVDRMLGRVP